MGVLPPLHLSSRPFTRADFDRVYLTPTPAVVANSAPGSLEATPFAASNNGSSTFGELDGEYIDGFDDMPARMQSNDGEVDGVSRLESPGLPPASGGNGETASLVESELPAWFATPDPSVGDQSFSHSGSDHESSDETLVRAQQAAEELDGAAHEFLHTLAAPEVPNLEWAAMDAEYDAEDEDSGEEKFTESKVLSVFEEDWTEVDDQSESGDLIAFDDEE